MIMLMFPKFPPKLQVTVSAALPLMFFAYHIFIRSVWLLGIAVEMTGKNVLPTVSETVLPNFNFIGWIGLFAPAGTPAPVITRLAAELQKVVAAPEVGQRLQQLGAEAKWMGPVEFRGYVVSEVARLPKILADIGVQPQ